MANGGGGGGLQAQMSRVTLQKKNLPPQQHTDTRSDLMKAIRDGEWGIVINNTSIDLRATWIMKHNFS